MKLFQDFGERRHVFRRAFYSVLIGRFCGLLSGGCFPYSLSVSHSIPLTVNPTGISFPSEIRGNWDGTEKNRKMEKGIGTIFRRRR
jgi:hypothetical protein